MSRDHDEFEPGLPWTREVDRRSPPHVKGALRPAGGQAGGYQWWRRPGRTLRAGRGQQAATVLRQIAEVERRAGRLSRRALVKVQVVRLRQGGQAAPKHMRYLARDGVTRGGAPGQLYGPEAEDLDRGEFLAGCRGDRRQLRVMISAEDGDQVSNLRVFTRDLMRQMETDLGTKIDWVAADHFNTGHPHTHIVVRGRDDEGADLIIAPDYVTRGLRLRAEARLTLELGLRTDTEFRRQLHAELTAEHLTRVDRVLLEESRHELMDLRPDPGQVRADPERTLRLGRLKTLLRFGLADEVEPGLWMVAPDIEPRLREIGESTEIIRTMRRAVTAHGLERAESDFVVQKDAVAPVIGRLLDKQLQEERDRLALVIDGVDGKVHYVEVVRPAVEELRIGGLVQVMALGAVRTLDQAGAELSVSDAERCGQPEQVQQLSRLALDDQVRSDGATWLDRELLSRERIPLSEDGFGAEVRAALDARKQELVRQGHAWRDSEGQIRAQPTFVSALRQQELERVGRELAGMRHQTFVQPAAGAELRGVVSERVELDSGPYGVFNLGYGFALVPWAPVVERHLGHEITAMIEEAGGVSWALRRDRGLER